VWGNPRFPTKECKGGECEKKIEKKKLEIDGNKK